MHAIGNASFVVPAASAALPSCPPPTLVSLSGRPCFHGASTPLPYSCGQYLMACLVFAWYWAYRQLQYMRPLFLNLVIFFLSSSPNSVFAFQSPLLTHTPSRSLYPTLSSFGSYRNVFLTKLMPLGLSQSFLCRWIMSLLPTSQFCSRLAFPVPSWTSNQCLLSLGMLDMLA